VDGGQGAGEPIGPAGDGAGVAAGVPGTGPVGIGVPRTGPVGTGPVGTGPVGAAMLGTGVPGTTPAVGGMPDPLGNPPVAGATPALGGGVGTPDPHAWTSRQAIATAARAERRPRALPTEALRHLGAYIGASCHLPTSASP
jgi:hypothetical protein